MALTSGDETDLLLPLYQGVYEEPRFSTFLGRLKRRTGAEYVALILRQTESPAADSIEFFAGLDLRQRARKIGIDELYTLEKLYRDRLRPGRVYSVADFVDHDPAYKARRARNVERLGIIDERIVRLSGESGVHAWLVLARSKTCSAADSALLSNLAPYVSMAVSHLVLSERQRIEAALTAEALGRSGGGWILFDRDAKILAIEEKTERVLSDLARIGIRVGDRLRDIRLKAERELAAAATDLAGNAKAAPRTVVLSEQPRIEALLVPADEPPIVTPSIPAMLALCRLPKDASPERAARLAQLFELPRREAELAIALSDGLSIAEASQAMGLTLETARSYSKRLYAKLGVRGQAELVRLVYQSSIILG